MIAPADRPCPAPLITLSTAIAGLPGLSELLGQAVLHCRHVKKISDCAGVVAWGLKPSAKAAAAYARLHGLPLLRLEDGLLRSINIGSVDPPLSIIVDDFGIYYDASTPSRLETLIKQTLTAEQRSRALQLIAAWRSARVSKYNHAREYAWPLPQPYVLVADQVAGDASIARGWANRRSFRRMLAAALRDYPDCTVVLKTHPDVVSGRKRGHFDWDKLAAEPRVTVLAENAHPVGLIEQSQAVYCVTSQLGFEGLLWNKSVHVFGMPFYAGWGLTQDALSAPKRRMAASLEQLVHAALIAYPRYLDPESGLRCEPERLLTWMGQQRRLREAELSPTEKPNTRQDWRSKLAALFD